MENSSNRRQFLTATSAAALGTVIAGPALAETPTTEASETETPVSLAGQVYKSVKWGMIETPGSVQEKFALMKSLGYDGMELGKSHWPRRHRSSQGNRCNRNAGTWSGRHEALGHSPVGSQPGKA